jgi:exopolyphosphatase/guanosine-5'-triphosphate,3'-diphosphate pyrophosphatase
MGSRMETRVLASSRAPNQSSEVPSGAPRPVAVIDMGASAIRLLIAEIAPDSSLHILEDASRGVLLGKETFTHGRIGGATMDAALRALAGFRAIMDGYGVVRYRAVATSAVREAANSDSFLDRVRIRTGLEIEIIDGSEENRLTYLAVRRALHGHPVLSSGMTLLVEIGGGSGDLSFLRRGEPVQSGTYALGALRMRQSLAAWHGSHDDRVRLLKRHIHNVVEDIRRHIPLREAQHFIALGGDMRFAASRIGADESHPHGYRIVSRDDFFEFHDLVASLTVDDLIERYRLQLADAETLVPALLAYRELLAETTASEVLVPDASMRAGLLFDLARASEGRALEELRGQVLASAEALGEKYRFNAGHARQTAQLAVKLFDDLRPEHGLGDRDRLRLEVAALLHDIGVFVGLRDHHLHSQYVLANAEIFGMSQDDMAIVANIARYHRGEVPSRAHPEFVALDRQERVDVLKMASLLRLANALDADHLQKVRGLRIVREPDLWLLETEGAGDFTIERLAALSRADLFIDVFGRKLGFREAGSVT